MTPTATLGRLDPRWVTGFTDGEGCFFVGIAKHAKMTLGYQVQLCFSISSFEGGATPSLMGSSRRPDPTEDLPP